MCDTVQVCGVDGGVRFTQHVLDRVNKEGLMCVWLKGNVYEIRPPLSGLLVSVDSYESGGGGSPPPCLEA